MALPSSAWAVLRSEDHGKSWVEWSVLADILNGDPLGDPEIQVARGLANEWPYVSHVKGGEATKSGRPARNVAGLESRYPGA
jgi:hypothetical protein